MTTYIAVDNLNVKAKFDPIPFLSIFLFYIDNRTWNKDIITLMPVGVFFFLS